MTLLKRRILRIGAVSGAALLAASCAETQLGAQAVKEVARSDARARSGPELAPDAFDATGLTIWDGASTLEGVWIAHPLAQRAQRVRVTNLENRIDVEGAMFRRDPTLSGPSILVSSDAARLLGLQPGVPTELRIIALREGVYAAPTATAEAAGGDANTSASDVETTALAAPEPQESEADTSEAEEDIAAVEAEAETAPSEETVEEGIAADDRPGAEPDPAQAAATDVAEPVETADASSPPPPTVQARERPKTAITADDLRGESAATGAPAPSEQPVPEQPADPAPTQTAEPAPAAQPAPADPPAPAQPEPAAPKPAEPQVAEAPAAAGSSGAFEGQLPKGRFVQAGAFGVEPNAASLVKTLRGAGLPAQYVKRDVGGSVLSIVMIGPLADDAAANAAIDAAANAAIDAAAKAGAPGARKVIR